MHFLQIFSQLFSHTGMLVAFRALSEAVSAGLFVVFALLTAPFFAADVLSAENDDPKKTNKINITRNNLFIIDLSLLKNGIIYFIAS